MFSNEQKDILLYNALSLLEEYFSDDATTLANELGLQDAEAYKALKDNVSGTVAATCKQVEERR